MYHSIVIKESLEDKEVLNNFKIINTKISGDWYLHILEIPNAKSAIGQIQKAMVTDKPYCFQR